MNYSYILNIVANFFDYEDIDGILLTGSYADDTGNSDSDIDIIVLSKRSCRQTTAEVVEDNHRIHFIIFPKYKIYDLIYDDIFKETYVFHSMFCNGIIISDKSNILYAVKCLLSGVRPLLKEDTIVNILHNIDGEFRYLKRNPEALSVAMNIIVLVERILIGFIAPQSHYIDRMMRSFPQERALLHNALAEYITTNKSTTLENVIYNITGKYCDKIIETASSDTLLRLPKNHHLMIHIPDERVYGDTSRRLIGHLYTEYPEFEFFAYYIGNYNIQHRGTYIVVLNKSGVNPESIIYNDRFKALISIESHVKYPCKTIFFTLNQFGDHKFRQDIYNIFIRCSHVIFNSIKDRNDSFREEFGYAVILNILKSLGCSHSSFIQNMILVYMPDAVNITGIVSYSGLSYSQNKLIEHLTDSYHKNKEQLCCFANNNNDTDIREICDNIVYIAHNCSEETYNSYLFSKVEFSIIFNIVNQILSIASLDSYQKLAICFNCSKICEYVSF